MEKKNNIPSTDKEKTAEELLKEHYLSAKDLTIIIPNLKIEKARIYINEIQEEMKEKKIYIPKTRPKIVLTKLVRKKFGF